MLGAVAAAYSLLAADYKRNFYLSTEHIADLGRLVQHLIHGKVEKVHVHKLHNGSHADAGRSDARSHKRVLRNRGVPHPVFAEFFKQAAGTSENTSLFGDIFAHKKDFRIPAHFFRQYVSYRVRIGLNAHSGYAPSTYMPSITWAGS